MGGLVSIVTYSCPALMIIVSVSQFHVYLPWGQHLFSIVSFLVGNFNQEKAIVGAFSVIVKTSPMVRLQL